MAEAEDTKARGDRVGTLYVVATPIGNLGDFSSRAAQVLRQADVIAAEDTRRVAKLLASLGITKPTLSFHSYSSPARLRALVRRLRGGQTIALVSDAGTPCISDPGAELVAEAWRVGARVVPIPGPSAVAAALCVAGFPAGRFVFAGYPPRGRGPRRRFIAEVVGETCPVVIFEAPSRTADLLQQISELAGPDRPIAVARELTKMHEEVLRGAAAEVLERWSRGAQKGEVVVVIGPCPGDGERAHERAPSPRDIASWLAREGLPPGRIAAALTSLCGVPRQRAYRLAQAAIKAIQESGE